MTTGRVDGDATARWLTSQRFAGLGETGRQAAEDQLAGAEVARRYADAWRHAIRTRGTITYSTPVVYITATRAH